MKICFGVPILIDAIDVYRENDAFLFSRTKYEMKNYIILMCVCMYIEYVDREWKAGKKLKNSKDVSHKKFISLLHYHFI